MSDQLFGFLNINKPTGCTSHDVIRDLKKSLSIKKIGHSGTLDPLASGVLIIGLNEATRLFEFLNSDKIYTAKILFGLETNTDDISGEVIKKHDYIPSIEEIKLKLKEFTGKIKQRPPIFSSVKINGKRAYSLARENKISLDEMKEKTIEIYSIKVNSYITNELDLTMNCSTGTYIRSFARDLGNSLNTGGCLSYLKRILVSKHFSIEGSIDPKIVNMTNVNEYLIQPANVLELPVFHLNIEQVKDISNGKEIKFNDNSCKINNLPAYIQLLSSTNSLIGIGLLQNENTIKPQKVLAHD